MPEEKEAVIEDVTTPVVQIISEEEEDWGSSFKDSEEAIFETASEPREGFEGGGDDLDNEPEEPGEERKPNNFSNPAEEDVASYQIGMGVLDNTRAMFLSFHAVGDISLVDKYTFYKNWDDPKHKAELRAGAIVAKKWKFSSFQNLPEFAILIALVASTLILVSQAKADKKEHAATKASTAKNTNQKGGKEIEFRPKRQKLSKDA